LLQRKEVANVKAMEISFPRFCRFVFCAVLAGWISMTAMAEKPVVKIGIITPLTGDLAFVGQSVRNGINYGLQDLGNTKFKYVAVFEDNQYHGTKTALITPKLINIDKVDALISTWTETGLIVSPIAEKYKVLHFGMCWAPKVAEGRYNFDIYAPPREQVRAYVAGLKKRGITSLAILYCNSNSANQLLEELNKQLPAAGIQVVAREGFNFGERDFRTVLAKINQKHPAALFMHGFSPEVELIGRQFTEGKFPFQLTSIEIFDETPQQSLFEGDWYAGPILADPALAERYRRQFGYYMMNAVPYMHDIVKIIAQAYESFPGDQKPTTDQVVDVISNMKSFSGWGGTFIPNKEGYFEGKSTIKMIKDGRSVIIGE
jgi:ABC-type branched-subunit amino acid transport system substrate-binding protein